MDLLETYFIYAVEILIPSNPGKCELTMLFAAVSLKESSTRFICCKFKYVCFFFFPLETLDWDRSKPFAPDIFALNIKR